MGGGGVQMMPSLQFWQQQFFGSGNSNRLQWVATGCPNRPQLAVSLMAYWCPLQLLDSLIAWYIDCAAVTWCLDSLTGYLWHWSVIAFAESEEKDGTMSQATAKGSWQPWTIPFRSTPSTFSLSSKFKFGRNTFIIRSLKFQSWRWSTQTDCCMAPIEM